MLDNPHDLRGDIDPAAAKPRRPQVGMPRRFSIGTAMILTAVFALLFGLLKTLDVPPVVFFVVSAFVAAIAVCQAVLFKGKNPRKASIVVGFVMGVLVVTVSGVFAAVLAGALGAAAICTLA